jgi:hypothetical protein
MAISKGISPVQIIEIISSLVDVGFEIDRPDFKSKVISKYNDIFSKNSKDTIIANLREDAMVQFQEDRFITKLPQDNSKVDLMSVKIINNVVDIRVSQQKGNDASFNSSSLSKTIDSLTKFIEGNKITDYFYLLPEHLNPNKNGLKYKVEVIIGMILACGEGNKRGIKTITNNEYLRYMGILSKDICDIDYWAYTQLKNRNHEYYAIDKCCNFDIIYDKCISIILNDGNK